MTDRLAALVVLLELVVAFAATARAGRVLAIAPSPTRCPHGREKDW